MVAPVPPESDGVGATIDVPVERIATGGEGVGRGADGRVVFVAGALPGERVVALVTEDKKSFRRADLVSVVEPSPRRISPPCPAVSAGCGGCDWQHTPADRQRELRRAIVVDSLTRIGRLDPAEADALVRPGPPLADTGYRTVLRAAVHRGRAGFRRHHSHEVVTADACLVAHPLAAELLSEGRFGAASEVRIVVGARTGERMVVVDADPAGLSVPPDVVVVGPDGHGSITEEVAGRRFRISARSFFQCRPDGAEALVAAVTDALDGIDGPLADLYAGVGLFTATVGAGRPVTAVEWSESSVADAAHNAAWATVIRRRVEHWRPDEAVKAVIADPARRGLGKQGVAAVVAAEPERIALVSCDPASLARDVALLRGEGYEPASVTLIDLFPQTSHLEAVTSLHRQ